MWHDHSSKLSPNNFFDPNENEIECNWCVFIKWGIASYLFTVPTPDAIHRHYMRLCVIQLLLAYASSPFLCRTAWPPFSYSTYCRPFMASTALFLYVPRLFSTTVLAPFRSTRSVLSYLTLSFPTFSQWYLTLRSTFLSKPLKRRLCNLAKMNTEVWDSIFKRKSF